MKPRLAIIANINITHEKLVLYPTARTKPVNRNPSVSPNTHPSWRVVFLCLFFAFATPMHSQTLSGTTVVVLVREDQIVIAADSKTYTVGTAGAIEPIKELSCKIVPFKDYVFAHAGLFHDSGSGFAVTSALRAADSAGGSLQEKVRRFEDVVAQSAAAIFTRIKQGDPVCISSGLRKSQSFKLCSPLSTKRGLCFFLEYLSRIPSPTIP